ncbi:unnamed protein product [Rhizophagus irregularis]|nr:unnamed protein product [Rhizophagus irregularis]
MYTVSKYINLLLSPLKSLLICSPLATILKQAIAGFREKRSSQIQHFITKISQQILRTRRPNFQNMILNGTGVPEVGKAYAIHPYSVEDGGASTVVTVQGTSVSMSEWAHSSNQKWECVEKDGWIGFICRKSTASENGAYLGYNKYEVLVCEAQYQDKWEDFQVVKHDQGCKLEMCKDDHLAYVDIQSDNTLKMMADSTTWWGFTEWLGEKWILSIDGGGIRGLIPALVLQQLEKDVSEKRGKDTRIADMFDMVSGNSTGSIISLGLTVSDGATSPRPMYPASELVKLYKEKGKEIFSNISRWNWFKVTNLLFGASDSEEEDPAVDIFDSAYFRAHTKIEPGDDEDGKIGPSYSPNNLEKLLAEKFADKSLKDTLKDVLVPSYNITEKKEVYFTNYSDVTSSYKIRDVIRASTAAPTYFESKKMDDQCFYIDGGVYMNNPAYKAYLEVKNKFKEQKIVVCSLGTGFFQDELAYLAKSGEIRWASPIINLMMNVSSKLVESYLENLKKDGIRYYRLQAYLQRDIPLDDTRNQALTDLEGLANSIINRKEYNDLVEDIVKHLNEED